MKTRHRLAILTSTAALGAGGAAAFACTVHGPTLPAEAPLATPVELVFPALDAPPARAQTSGVSRGPVVASIVAATKGPARYRLRAVGRGTAPGGYNGDVWGHRGHGYLSSWGGPRCPSDGVRVFDLRNPRRPVHVATFADDESDPAVAGSWTEKTIVQHVSTRAFTGALALTSFQRCRERGFQGFGLYDVTDPRAPQRFALVPTDPRGSHEIWLQPRGNQAFVWTAIMESELRSSPDYNARTHTASTPGEPDFRIYDVSVPTAPVEVGGWGAWRALGIQPRDGDRTNLVHSVRGNLAGTRAYLSYWDLGSVILDVSNPAAPRYLGRTRNEENAHSTALAKGGRLLIETHETRGGVPTFYDISNPGAPKRRGSLVLPATSRPLPRPLPAFANSVHDAKVRNSRAYFSWYSQGVVVADIARPARPRVIAQWLPPKTPDPGESMCRRTSCRLVWGVFPQRDYVLASDILSGLWVLKLERRLR
ncbi:MAG: hypothetical protein ICV59_06770 [Thermoleophilia bacterium]|nr:hypothetical protein [Thermoleophilia bacterium]